VGGCCDDDCRKKMNAKQTGWSLRYQIALRKHLKLGLKSSLRPALKVGRRAVALGLETLDVARIHEAALAALGLSSSREGVLKRAGIFFAEAITPIERTHRAARMASRRVKQLTETLDRRTSGLAASQRRLKLRIAQRRSAEEALKRSGGHNARLLEESYRLQKHLKHLTHRIISAQEQERKKISRELHHEIAQTLLGIDVRLLTLRMGAVVNARGLKKEVASTQRLVEISEKLMRRFTRELGIHDET
jgi:signal transduction histidine kinase